MEWITPATIPRSRPRTAEHERPRLAYSTTSSTPGTIRGFLKPNTPTETIAATGMLRAGRRLIAITAKREHELQTSLRHHTCDGCQQTIVDHRITTTTKGTTADEHFSDHHHWHEGCFKQSESGTQEHALGRWAIISWEEN